MLPKAHLTSHSRMSGSRWVTTPSLLSGSLRAVLYTSSVYSCHLFLISSAYVRSLPFLSFIMPIFSWNVPLLSPIFLKRSQVFPIPCFLLFLCTVHWRPPSLSLLFSGTLHSGPYLSLPHTQPVLIHKDGFKLFINRIRNTGYSKGVRESLYLVETVT